MPTQTSGKEMRNQMHRSEKKVPSGTAPDERLPQMKKLRRKKMPKTMPGYRNAVRSVSYFQTPPLNALYVMAAE